MTANYTVPGLDAEQGRKAAELLQERLTALLDLHLTLKHIHWNVVGPSFIGVHEMLDPQVDAVREMSDAVAERIATLGGQPNGLPGYIAKTRTWDDYSLGRETTQAHLAALDVVYNGLNADHRKAIAEIGEIDPVSEDLLIGQTNQLEMFQWFVRAHLEDRAGQLPHASADGEQEAADAATGASS